MKIFGNHTLFNNCFKLSKIAWPFIISKRSFYQVWMEGAKEAKYIKACSSCGNYWITAVLDPSRKVDILTSPTLIYVLSLSVLWLPGWISVVSMFQVMILLCNQQSFICTHVDYCHPHCYLHHSRSCARLVRAIKLLYGDTVDSLRESNNTSNVALRGKKQKEVSEKSIDNVPIIGKMISWQSFL